MRACFPQIPCSYFCVEKYFLVNWTADEDLFDVIAAKEVVPPEDHDILDVKAGMICRVMYQSKFYPAKIIESGK